MELEWFKEAWQEERELNREFRLDVCDRLGNIETWVSNEVNTREVREQIEKKARERVRALLGVLGLFVAIASVVLPLILR